MDDSPIPRCNFKYFAVILCFALVLIMALELNVSTYANIDDENCFGFTSVYETDDIGITNRIGIIVPICCCAFFALRQRKKKSDTKIISPPSCHQYSKILNC